MMSAQPQLDQRPPREWVELITISSPKTPLVVRVQTTVTGRPLYSLEIGHLRDGKVLRHLPVYVQGDGLVTPFDTRLLEGMIRQAEEAVAVDAGRKAVEWRGRQDAWDARGGRVAERPQRRERRSRPDRDDER